MLQGRLDEATPPLTGEEEEQLVLSGALAVARSLARFLAGVGTGEALARHWRTGAAAGRRGAGLSPPLGLNAIGEIMNQSKRQKHASTPSSPDK